MPEWVASCRFRCSHDPVERIIFLDFRGSGMQIEGEQNMVSIAAPSFLISQVQWEVSDKERDFGFCCPQICIQRLIMD